MGIDRIGKGGLPPTDISTGGSAVEKKGSVDKPFSVERTSPAEARRTEHSSAVDATGASPLARLRRGEIDANGYADLKVEEATRGLEGLSPAELDAVRKVLRDQLATDPGLTDLAQKAAGKAPDIPEE